MCDANMCDSTVLEQKKKLYHQCIQNTTSITDRKKQRRAWIQCINAGERLIQSTDFERYGWFGYTAYQLSKDAKYGEYNWT